MWADSQRRAHEVHWPDVDRLFTSLPAHLFRQAKLLEYDLALRYSASGQFREIYRGADQFPILSIAGWLTDDLGIPVDVDRQDVERRLFLVQLLLAAQAQLLEGIADSSSFSDERQFALAEFCTTRIGRELACLIPAGAPFWDEYDVLATDQLDRRLERRERETGAVLHDEPEAYLHGRWAAPARIVALAATSVAGVTDIGPAVGDMLASLANAFQVRDDVAALHRDLQQGRITYAIAIVAQAADIPLRPAPSPDRVLGAMVATRSLTTILQVPATIVEECQRTALELGLPTMASYLDAAGAHFAEAADRVSMAAATRQAPAPPPAPSVALMLRFEPTVLQALGMAERFLLADRTFRESWEMHREGMFGAAEVWSRFPAGLIVEILQRWGHDVTSDIDDFLARTVANGFRYYEHPWSDADADTVGVFLRLRPHATAPDAHAQPTAHILDCLDRLVTPAGGIPVWIADPDATDELRPPLMALGEGCGTVAAHLLLGLAPEAGDRYHRTVRSGAAHLLDRLSSVGAAANVNYPPLYAIGIFCRLLVLLDEGVIDGPLAGQVGRARQKLLADLDMRLPRVTASPQDSALAAIACRAAGQPDHIDSRWLSTILKQQRADGSWAAEPFAAAPNRGGWVSWYSSATLTSALCYDALAASDGLARRAPVGA